MKQKIYEIPIWEAYETQNCECPLCSIEKNLMIILYKLYLQKWLWMFD